MDLQILFQKRLKLLPAVRRFIGRFQRFIGESVSRARNNGANYIF